MNNKNEINILNESQEALIELIKSFDNNEEAFNRLIEIIKEKGKLDETFFIPLQER